MSHPITNAIDGSHSWWQSPTLAQGKEYEFVTIDIDLKQVSDKLQISMSSACNVINIESNYKVDSDEKSSEYVAKYVDMERNDSSSTIT